MASNLERTALRKDFSKFGVAEADLLIEEKPDILNSKVYYNHDIPAGWLQDQSISNDLVTDQFGRNKKLIDEYHQLAIETLSKLGNFPETSVTDPNISLDLPSPPAVDALNVNKPGKPSYTTPDVGTAPGLRGDLEDIVMREIQAPSTALPDAPTETLDWQELPYISTLWNRLYDSVVDIVQNGGTGLDEDWEAALIARGRAKLDEDYEEKRLEAERYYSSKGHKAPPGGLLQRLNMLGNEHSRNLGLLNSDVIAKQIEHGRQHTQFMHDVGVKLETLSRDSHDKVQTRALEAAKSVITFLHDNYKVRLEAIYRTYDIYKTQVDAERTRIEATASKNRSIAEIYSAEIDAYVKRVEVEFTVIEQVIKMYVAEIGGYEAEVRAEASRLQALVERYRAQVGAAEVQGQISLGEYEQMVQAVLAEIQLKLGVEEELGRIVAQILASALSAQNVSASVSDSTSKGLSKSESTSISTSNSFTRSLANALTVSASQSESASDSYTESLSFSYGEGDS